MEERAVLLADSSRVGLNAVVGRWKHLRLHHRVPRLSLDRWQYPDARSATDTIYRNEQLYLEAGDLLLIASADVLAGPARGGILQVACSQPFAKCMTIPQATSLTHLARMLPMHSSDAKETFDRSPHAHPTPLLSPSRLGHPAYDCMLHRLLVSDLTLNVSKSLRCTQQLRLFFCMYNHQPSTINYLAVTFATADRLVARNEPSCGTRQVKPNRKAFADRKQSQMVCLSPRTRKRT